MSQMRPSPSAHLVANKIIERVCSERDVSVEAVLGPSRSKTVANVRHQAMTEVRDKTNLSWSEIGCVFNRDHSAVIYAVNKFRGTNRYPYRFEPYERETAPAADRVAWALCQILDDDAPIRWTRFRYAAECIAHNPEVMDDLLELAGREK